MLLIILAVLLLIIIGLLVFLILGRRRRGRYDGEKLSVYVQGGMNTKSQKWGKNRGAYFKGGVTDYRTYVIKGKAASVWRIVFEEEGTGRRLVFHFQGRMGIGRAKSREEMVWLCLRDEKVSREHGLIYESDGKLYLADLQAKNGTRLNGKRIDGPVMLQNGDSIGIGNTCMRVTFQKKVQK